MNFETDVLAKSDIVPVVVDFWAPWCGPCRVLGPVIEELAGKAAGEWELVKINTDEDQQTSAQYGIRGIPAVKMFFKGNVIAEFTGALPRHDIQKWLNQYLPSEEKQQLAEIKEALQRSNPKAIVLLEAFVMDYPASDEGKILLAGQVLWSNAKKATELTANVQDRNKYFEELKRIEVLAGFVLNDLKGSEPVVLKLKAAQRALQNNDKEEGVGLLIEAVSLDKNYLDELPRQVAVAFFQLEGQFSELAKKYRRKFDMALY